MGTGELRLKNLVLWNGVAVSIDLISDDTVNVLDENSITGWYTVGINEIEPIALTEEWLIKFGANLFPWGWVINEILIRTNNKQKFWIELGNGKRIELPYVHTFQNFISLAGEELTYQK